MNEQWIQIFTIIIANLGVIWWFRKESREDWKMCNANIQEMRKESREDWKRSENIINAIKDEMKDFHERLLKIEMTRKK